MPRPVLRCAAIALSALVGVVPVPVRHAAAGMYTWVDDQGDRHLVDSREKVPVKYRSRARELSPDEPRAPAGPTGGDNQGVVQPGPPSGATPRPPGQVRREDASRGGPAAFGASAGWIDRVRARWVAGLSAAPPAGERLARWLPREAALRFGVVIVIAVVLVRALAAFGALRAARGLAVFASGYRALLERRAARVEPAHLEELEQRLPTVHRWCRAARLGVTTIGASREVGMGRVMDEGRVDVLHACLTRPELVGQHTLAVVARAEGVHRHRARRPLSSLGVLEVLAFWPRYLVWRTVDDAPGGVRVLLSMYWLGVLVWAVLG